MELITFNLHGVDIIFNHKAKKGEYFFTEPKTGHGFYNNSKEFTGVWGRPNKKTCEAVAKSYVDSNEERVRILKTYA